MSQPTYYPRVDTTLLADITLLVSAIRQDPDLSKSPYPPEVRAELLPLLSNSAPVTASGAPVDSVDFSESEIITMLNQFKRLETSLQKLEVGEQIQVLKTKAQLVERLVLMLERVTNVKKMGEFQAEVLRFLDEMLTEDQKQLMLDRLLDGVI